MTQYHFISGLPRAGSTLLSALLRQNPAVRAGIVSPVGSLVAAVLKDMGPDNETSLFLDEAQRAALLRGLFDSYYGALPPGTAVFDTNRGWTGRLDLLARLFPDCRVICCVRPVPWIIDSVERLIRRNVFEVSKIFGSDVGGTAYSRAELMMAPSGLIGFPLNAMKQAMHGDHSARLLLLPYDTLAEHPQETLAAVYEFCGLPPFKHDVDDIAFDAGEFDARLGTPGLHAVRPQARREVRETILPPDLWARWEGASVWRDPAFHRRVAVGGTPGADHGTAAG
ncbi:sulfotransferase [Methylobacterium sp. NEAU 140]|uniref:sulfotransferase family protein n=1 Tax=Methylobacterium sp. NEAU 140 TaxID=3064945 RepID=UPI0027333491|nr:sulfotransferase [Methylobacterium sp. NEAU 140]MDP4026265.1 sulfotransferase [Methylobacterium sp. NEAU 140]